MLKSLEEIEERFTEDEKVILRNLPEKYKWIARDKYGYLQIAEIEPQKLEDEYVCYNVWVCKHFNIYDHLFKSIKWEDEEPCEFRKYL